MMRCVGADEELSARVSGTLPRGAIIATRADPPRRRKDNMIPACCLHAAVRHSG